MDDANDREKVLRIYHLLSYIWKVYGSRSKIIIVNKLIVFASLYKKRNRLLEPVSQILQLILVICLWNLLKMYNIPTKNSSLQYSKISNQSFAKQIDWVVSSCVKYWPNVGQENWYWQPLVFSTTFTSRFYKNRSSHGEVVLRKGVLKIWIKSTGEHPYRSVISIKLLCSFIEITRRDGCSHVNLLHIFRTPFPKSTCFWKNSLLNTKLYSNKKRPKMK